MMYFLLWPIQAQIHIWKLFYCTTVYAIAIAKLRQYIYRNKQHNWIQLHRNRICYDILQFRLWLSLTHCNLSILQLAQKVSHRPHTRRATLHYAYHNEHDCMIWLFAHYSFIHLVGFIVITLVSCHFYRLSVCHFICIWVAWMRRCTRVNLWDCLIRFQFDTHSPDLPIIVWL